MWLIQEPSVLRVGPNPSTIGDDTEHTFPAKTCSISIYRNELRGQSIPMRKLKAEFLNVVLRHTFPAGENYFSSEISTERKLLIQGAHCRVTILRMEALQLKSIKTSMRYFYHVTFLEAGSVDITTSCSGNPRTK